MRRALRTNVVPSEIQLMPLGQLSKGGEGYFDAVFLRIIACMLKHLTLIFKTTGGIFQHVYHIEKPTKITLNIHEYGLTYTTILIKNTQ